MASVLPGWSSILTLVWARSAAGTKPVGSNGSSDSAFTNARLMGQWRQRLGGVRAELNGGGGAWRARSDSLRTEFGSAGVGLSK